MSQAAMARMNGARKEAIHLAYYAELRAAISILAGFGIGILKSKHFALVRGTAGSPARVVWFNGNTHEITWDALAEWSNQGASADIVVRTFSTLGLTGAQWLEACRATTSANVIAQYWLQNWSVDLKDLKKPVSSSRVSSPNDSMLRNEASYRVDLTTDALNPLTRSDVELIRNAHLACTPVAYGQFDTIDLAIIHDLCRKACQANYTYATPANMVKLWRSDIKPELEKLMSPQDTINAIKQLVDAPNTPGGKVLSDGNTNNKTGEAVFCRALLLLRLASGLQRHQWQEISRLSPGGVVNWRKAILNDYGTQCQLWDIAAPPSDYLDLDSDRQEADENVEDWLNGNTLTGSSLWKNRAYDIVQLCRFERIALMAAAV